MKRILLIFIILIINSSILPAKKFIDRIIINQKDVFDTSQTDWFFAAPIANSIHPLTKLYVVEDELLFEEEGELIRDDLYETVRNLRATNLFSDVTISIDTVSEYFYDVNLTTQDKWSTMAMLIFGTGGSATTIGGGFEETNLFGIGTNLRVDGYHRSENNIGWQGGLFLNQRRIFRTEYFVEIGISGNQYKTNQNFGITKPYRTLATKWSYGVNASNSFGRDFLYRKNHGSEFMPAHVRKVQFWGSRAWQRNDRVFATALLEADDVNRSLPEYVRAYDNSGKFLVAFSSVSEHYFQTDKLNTYQVEDVPIGGWGQAIIGKIFPLGSRGDNYFYIGGQAEKSFIHNNLYLFGQVTGASSFSMSQGYNTYEEVLAKGFYRLNTKTLIACRLRQQTAWNWNQLRQLILDNDAGLRGYTVNSLAKDNRLVLNTEFRLFPDWQVWIINLGAVAFWDSGAAWDQNTKLSKTEWRNSAGLGIRFFNMKGTGESSIFRLDFAFNFHTGKFAEIIFSSGQLFSVFENHRFRLPQVYGTEFDYE